MTPKIIDVKIGLGSQQTISVRPERRLNIVDVVRAALTPEQRNEEQRQRERNAIRCAVKPEPMSRECFLCLHPVNSDVCRACRQK